MTGRSIDHIVHTVRNLDLAARQYEEQGFTLTPRARHEDRMGTSNRLAQFKERNFIELLEVDRPEKLAPHDWNQNPPLFGFGAHNKQFLDTSEGFSMLVFASDDAREDNARFAAKGITTYAPFDFERQATLPDGETVTVSFSLAFATSADMPRVGFFVCQNRAQQHFWKPDFQHHANGSSGIQSAIIATTQPQRDAEFVARLFDGSVSPVDGGLRVACGSQQSIVLQEPDAIDTDGAPISFGPKRGPFIASVALNSEPKADRPADLTLGGAIFHWA